MASKKLAQSVFRCASTSPARILAVAPRITFTQSRVLSPSYPRYLHTTRCSLQDATPASKPAQSITTPKPAAPPGQEGHGETDPGKHSAYLGEADSDDGFETYKDTHGDPPPSVDATNSAFHGEADSDDGFEAGKIVDGEKLEAVDATNSAFLGEADSDDGFVAHRDAHPEEGDHKIENPEESGLHGQPGELDQSPEPHK